MGDGIVYMGDGIAMDWMALLGATRSKGVGIRAAWPERRVRGVACAAALVGGAFSLVACSPVATTSTDEVSAVASAEAGSAAIVRPAGEEDVKRATLACMAERGWSGTSTADSIVWDPVPVDQGSAFESDNRECSAQAAELWPEPASLTDALLRLNYERTQAAVSCYEKHRFAYEPLPSSAEFEDRYFADNPYTVSALLASTSSQDGLAAAEAACPDPFAFFFDPSTQIYDEDVDYTAYEAAR